MTRPFFDSAAKARILSSAKKNEGVELPDYKQAESFKNSFVKESLSKPKSKRKPSDGVFDFAIAKKYTKTGLTKKKGFAQTGITDQFPRLRL